jgi:ribose transport system substrate-binding protein
MKRYVLVALLAAAGLLMTGCNKGTPPKSDSLSIAFVTNQIADFWTIAEAGCRDAEKDFNVEVIVRKPAEKTAVEQKRIVEDLLTSGIDAIAISPLDADNQREWLDSIAAKVPLITHDSDAPGTNRLVYIGMDNYKAGRMCGELVKEAIPDGGNVMLFIGRMEQDNSKYRRQGVIDELLDRDRDAEYYKTQTDAWDPIEGEIPGGKYEILGTTTDNGAENAQQKAEDALNAYPDVDAMVGMFEYNPPAIHRALEKANLLGKVKLIGFDENSVTLQAIRDGQCSGTIAQDPYKYGYESVKFLTNYLQDKDDSTVQELLDRKFVDIPPRKITKENVDEFEADLKAKTGR